MKQFFINLIDANNSLSSNRFIMVTMFPAIVCISAILVMYCAVKAIGLPSGSTELLVGLAISAAGQSVATKISDIFNKTKETNETTPTDAAPTDTN